MNASNFLAGLLSSDTLLYIGMTGVLVGFLLFTVFIYRRIIWLLRSQTPHKGKRPGLGGSLRNLVLILVLVLLSGVLLFGAFFMRAWQAFTYEQAVAEVRVSRGAERQTGRLTLIQILDKGERKSQVYLIRGDQWMLEGDILKWGKLVNFLGLHTRYRFTRLRGRYLLAEEELAKPSSIYSLVDKEDHPLWRWLYRHGRDLPLVSTVYGNAVYQMADQEQRFMVYVGTSGFIIRQKPESK
jgi:hypothetical protein